jgi:hypothetical protein
MALPTSYFTSTKNIKPILAALQRGQVPSKFNYDYLKQLGFPSSNDRPMIPMLKVLGFLDSSGAPKERYRRFKNAAEAKNVMAEGVREAYTDVFAIDEAANALPPDKIQGIFARLSEKGETVTNKMGMTFRAFVEEGDFSAPQVPPGADAAKDQTDGGNDDEERDDHRRDNGHGGVLSLRHDVHVHLPVSEDIKVYDAIFRSLRDNLLQ